MRLYLLLLGTLVFSGTALAVSTEDRLLACSEINDTTNRLACYDNLAEAIATPTAAAVAPTTPEETTETQANPAATATEPASTAGTVATTSTDPEEGFGKEHWVSERDSPALAARVTAVRKNAYGKLVVSLDNGQVWRQVKSEKVRIAVDDSILIERGMLNSFFFQVNDNNRKMKFSRVD